MPRSPRSPSRRALVVANGQPFGSVGPYEKLTGTIEFALDPADPRNKRIVDLDAAARGSDGRVHFSADLYVLQPVDPSRGNGTLLFEIANRGRKGILGRFNRAGGSQDPDSRGRLRRRIPDEGRLHRRLGRLAVRCRAAEPSRRRSRGQRARSRARLVHSRRQAHRDAPRRICPQYPPANPDDPSATLDGPRSLLGQADGNRPSGNGVSPSANGRPRVVLDGGFEPGACTRWTTTAAALASPASGSPRFATRRRRSCTAPTCRCAADRRTSSASRRADASCVSSSTTASTRTSAIAACSTSCGRTSPARARDRSTSGSRCPATRPSRRRGSRSRISSSATRKARATASSPGTSPIRLPKVIYTNTSVEYWGQGRAAALTHTAIDGKADATVPDNVRIYLLSGTQHGEAAFPPSFGTGQAMGNPTPQANVMRALLRAAHQWASSGARPPDSRLSAAARRDARSGDGAFGSQPFRVSAIHASIEGPGETDQRPVLGAAVPRPAGRCRRQRAGRHSRSGSVGAAGDDDRLELPRRARGQSDDDRRARSARTSRSRERGPSATRGAIRARRSRSATRAATTTSSGFVPPRTRSSRSASFSSRMSRMSCSARRSTGTTRRASDGRR